MPPTLLTTQTLKGPFDPISVGDMNILSVSPDTVNGNAFNATGREILLVINYGAESAISVTFTSTLDNQGRLRDITNYSVPDNTIAIFTGGLTNDKGWKQTSGQVHFKVTGVGSTVAVLKLP